MNLTCAFSEQKNARQRKSEKPNRACVCFTTIAFLSCYGVGNHFVAALHADAFYRHPRGMILIFGLPFVDQLDYSEKGSLEVGIVAADSSPAAARPLHFDFGFVWA